MLHPLGPTALNLSIDGNVLVSPGGSINADGQGYGAGYGPGYGDKAGNPWSGSGAGHGGYGGISSSNALGGNVYDSIFQPVDKGSAGGNGIGGAGGIGGGAIKLVIGSALQLDGSISANGADATNSRSGGGSGGSIWISAGTVAGTGSISANGGMGEPIHGGGGGGGRAAVYFGTNAFTGSYSAHGGTGFVTGGAGTVYTKTNLAGVSVGQVLLDNNGRYGTNTPLQLTNVSDLTVRGGAVAGVGLAVTVGNLLVESNGWIVSTPVAANSLPNLTITATVTRTSNKVVESSQTEKAIPPAKEAKDRAGQIFGAGQHIFRRQRRWLWRIRKLRESRASGRQFVWANDQSD